MLNCSQSLLIVLIFCQSFKFCTAPKPILVRVPQDYYPLRGGIQLACEADGSPTPQVNWSSLDSSIRILKAMSAAEPWLPWIDQQSSILHISNPKTKHKYHFYCNASNSYGWTVSQAIHVGQAFLDKEFYAWPDNQIVVLGKSVTLRCIPPDGLPQPSVYWMKDNQNVSYFSGFGSDLIIAYAQMTDEGQYKCVASNIAGRRESWEGRLIVQKRPIKIATSSSFFVQKPFVAKEGETVFLHCPLAPLKNETLHWIPPSSNMDVHQRMTLRGTALTIDKVRLSDSGEYLCKSLPESRAVVQLIVKALPTLLQTPEDQEVPQGSTVVFQCVAIGFPKPIIYWDLPNGLSLVSHRETLFHSTLFRVHADDRLEARNVGPSVSGKYQCNAHNALGSITASAVLTVTTRHVQMHPVIKEAPQNQTISTGSTVTLTCSSVGTPDPLIEWFKHVNENVKELIKFDGHRFLRPTVATLQILDVTITDSGNFSCTAHSGSLYTSWEFHIRIVDPRNVGEDALKDIFDALLVPPAPYDLKVLTVTSHSISLSWNMSRDYTKHILFRVEIEKMGSGRGWEVADYACSTPYTVISRLDSDSEYRFVVRALSRFGISVACGPTYNIRTSGDLGSSGLYIQAYNFDNVVHLLHSVEVEHVEVSTLSSTKVRVDWIAKGSDVALRSISGYKLTIRTLPLTHCVNSLTKSTESNSAENLRYCSVILSPSIEFILLQLRDVYLENGLSSIHINVSRYVRESVVSTSTVSTDVQSTVVKVLKPFRCYSITVEPFSHPTLLGDLFGKKSSDEPTVLTDEDIPSVAPRNITVQWISNVTALLTWLPPRIDGWNGLLRDYLIHVFQERSEQVYTRIVNASVNHTILTNLIHYRSYIVHMAVRNCKGVGIRSAPTHLYASLKVELNDYIFNSDHDRGQTLLSKSWFIAALVIGTFIWLFFSFVMLYMFCLKTMFTKGKKLHLAASNHYREVITSPDHLLTSLQSSPSGKDPLFKCSIEKVQSSRRNVGPSSAEGGIYASSAFPSVHSDSNGMPLFPTSYRSHHYVSVDTSECASPYATTTIVPPSLRLPISSSETHSEAPISPPYMFSHHLNVFDSHSPISPHLPTHSTNYFLSAFYNNSSPSHFQSQSISQYAHHASEIENILSTHSPPNDLYSLYSVGSEGENTGFLATGIPSKTRRSGASSANASFYSPPRSHSDEYDDSGPPILLPPPASVQQSLEQYELQSNACSADEEEKIVLSRGKPLLLAKSAAYEVTAVEMEDSPVDHLASPHQSALSNFPIRRQQYRERKKCNPSTAKIHSRHDNGAVTAAAALIEIQSEDVNVPLSNKARRHKHGSHTRAERTSFFQSSKHRQRRRSRKSAPYLDDSLPTDALIV